MMDHVRSREVGREHEHAPRARFAQPHPEVVAAVAVPAVQRDHHRQRRPAVPDLRHVEGEPAPLVAFVGSVEHAAARLVLTQGRLAQPRHEGVVVAPRGLEKPAAHRVQHGRQRVERLLERREAAQRPVEADGLLGHFGRGGEGLQQADGLPRHLDEAAAHEIEVGRPGGRFELAQGVAEHGALRGQRLRQLRRQGGKQVTLYPSDALECAE